MDVKVIPRQARLRMEKKTELEAQVFNKLGSDGGRHTQWFQASRVAAQPNAFLQKA